MKHLWMVVGLSALIGCSTRDHSSGHYERKRVGSTSDIKAVVPAFELRVKSDDAGVSELIFRFPDRPAIIPRINSLSIDQIGADARFCELDANDVDGQLIVGYWVVGSVPDNFRAKGCNQTSLPVGRYEMSVFTQRGEFRRHIIVGKNYGVDVLPWEEPEGL
jgi:hypothetical protein